MKKQINEIKRMQQLAGIITEAELGVNVISNPIPNVIGDSGDFRVKLKIGDKYVLSAKASNNPSEGELHKNLKALEKEFGNKYDFEKAELVVLDPKGKQVGSVKKQGATGGSGERPDGAFKIQLKIDGKPVMTTTADGNPSPEELSNTLTDLEFSYKNKFDFDKAEIVVLDPNGKQVGSITKRDNFLRTKATYVGDTYPTTHGTV
jgi:hypothetical protein